nr:vWA domain-containing protein [Planctomicrobium sp.]
MTSKIPLLLTTLVAASTCFAAEPIVRSYESPTGETYGSISVQLPASEAVRTSVDHVVLIDTSASQVGEHRKMGLQALTSFLKNLPEGHRATVVAVDIAAVPMLEGFAAPQQAADKALAKLNDRFPAGSTNMGAGLQAASELLKSSQNGSITFIGDGMSSAKLLQIADMETLTKDLRARQIPVHSFAVGSNKDMQMLGVLGQETGGFVIRDETSQQSLDAEQVGQLLAKAASKVVEYPAAVSINNSELSLLPSRALPLRSDRETVYLFQGELNSEATLVAGNNEWKNLKATRTTGNTFLQTIWHNAVATDGLVLGLSGDWMVNLTHQQFENNVNSMEARGVNALKQGAFETAEQIGFSIQEIDPGNQTAMQLINQAGEKMVLQTVQFEQANPAVDDAVDAANQLNEDRTAPRTEDPINAYEKIVGARTQALRADVDRGIQLALSVVDQNPDAAYDKLSQIRGAVKSATDIDPEARNQLLRQISAVQQDVASRRQKIALENAERNKRRVEIEAQARLIDFAEERDAKLEQMVDRIRALLIEGYQGDPGAFESAEAVGRGVLSEYPNSAMGVSVVFVSEAAGQLDKAKRLQALRSDRFLETLYQVELSHVPFPDEPPVRYPPAEVWQALTILREKWKSVDLRNDSPNEQKIYDALDQITNVEFPGNPLTDVIEYISSQHGIPIIIDETELSNDGRSGDDEVELVLSGITLRSALKLLLEPLALTYVIEDEVMKITTELAATGSLQTRVYPVADLVIPIFPLGGGFGGGLGGQQGGQQGNQQGNQQGGFGGGNQGGQNQGQGVFSVPAQPIPTKKKPILQ